MKGKPVLLFPGQGSQVLGMGHDLVEKEPELFDLYSQADGLLCNSISKLCFFGPQEKLDKDLNAQLAIYVTTLVYFSFFKKLKIVPAIVAGHSMGFYAACVASGALTFEQGVKITKEAGVLTTSLFQDRSEGKGAMAAINGLPEAKVDHVCREVDSLSVFVANVNASRQIVISGLSWAVDKAISRCIDQGALSAKTLKCSVPYHCKLLKEPSKKFGRLIDEMEIKDPAILVSNPFGKGYLEKSKEIRDTLKKLLISQIRWSESIESIVKDGYINLIECGPGDVLSRLVKLTCPKVKIIDLYK